VCVCVLLCWRIIALEKEANNFTYVVLLAGLFTCE